MSTDWRVRCRDCNDVGGCDVQRRVSVVRDIVSVADSLALLAAIESRIEINCEWVDLGFFKKHQGHRLIAHDEYGRDDGQCDKWMTCGDCSTHFRCKLEDGHDGPCERGERR